MTASRCENNAEVMKALIGRADQCGLDQCGLDQCGLDQCGLDQCGLAALPPAAGGSFG
jgi:hypothetical protein